MSEPVYSLKGDTIYKRPIETPNDDGTKNVTLGFPVCQVSEWVAAADLVDFLNHAEVCIKACAGIPTEALEGASVRALVDAVGKIVKHMESRGMQHWKVCKQSRSALAPFLKGTSDEQ